MTRREYLHHLFLLPSLRTLVEVGVHLLALVPSICDVESETYSLPLSSSLTSHRDLDPGANDEQKHLFTEKKNGTPVLIVH